MRFAAAIVALVGVVSATGIEKRAVDPAAATASLLAALPTSLQQLALTNLPAASSAIASAVANPTGPPSWFVGLPAEVQTYFITAAGGTVAAASSTGGASAGSSALSSISSAIASGSSAAASSSNSAGSAAGSASYTAGAAFPTAALGSGLIGAAGVVVMLAL